MKRIYVFWYEQTERQTLCYLKPIFPYRKRKMWQAKSKECTVCVGFGFDFLNTIRNFSHWVTIGSLCRLYWKQTGVKCKGNTRLNVSPKYLIPFLIVFYTWCKSFFKRMIRFALLFCKNEILIQNTLILFTKDSRGNVLHRIHLLNLFEWSVTSLRNGICNRSNKRP